MLVGSSNAVNLTDGLDGLAIGLMIIAAGAMTASSFLSGNADFARYLELARTPGASELTIFCGAMTGASLGFLWYNAHPAEVFMGDVGSLALGGGLGVVAVLLKQEVLLLVHRRRVCDRSGVGDPAGGQLQAARQANFQNGAAASSLRTDRMAGIESDRAFLDRGADPGAVRVDDVETEMKLAGAKVVVVGMARSGVAAVELLREKGASVRAVDQNPRVEARSRAADRSLLRRCGSDRAFARRSRGSRGSRRRPRGAACASSAIWNWPAGSWKAKSSASPARTARPPPPRLPATFCKQSGIPVQVGGNIGTPPASMVKTSRAGQWNVLELSSFQLETTDTFRAHIGAALNVTPDHLDRHDTLERYADAKGRLFLEQTRDDFKVLNADDPICESYARRGDRRCRLVQFDARSVARSIPRERRSRAERNRRDEDSAKFRCAACITSKTPWPPRRWRSLAGATHAQIRAAVMTFPGVEHRLEFVRDRAESPGTTIRKPPTWTRRSKPSRRLTAACG